MVDWLKANADGEVSDLVKLLQANLQRLEELTGGEVDAVADSHGRPFLLREAQNQLRNSDAAKQAAILNALPAHIALLDDHGRIVSVNEAWRRLAGANVIQSHGYEVGRNYLDICDGAEGDDALEAHQIADGIRSVLKGDAESYSIEYSSHFPSDQRWYLLSVTPLATGRGSGAVVMHLNITEQKLHAAERNTMEEALFVERERAQVTLNSIGDAVACTDSAGNITFLNVVAEKMSGWSLPQATGKPMAEVLHILDARSRETIANPMDAAAEGNRIAHLPPNAVLLRRDGSEIPIEDSVAPIHDREGKVTGAVIVFRDVSASQAMALQMAHSAQHDFLTGLPNRMLLNDRIGLSIALARRHKKKVAVLFLDLDGFKHINDSLGHPIGDSLLQSVSKRLVSCVRGGDTVSRQGGDEFVVLLSEVEEVEDAAVIARRMLQAVAEVHAVDAHDLHVTTSIGISVFPDDGPDAETLIKNADTAMYQAKENGRHTYQFFKPVMNARAVERQSIELSLRSALQRQEFILHYQPRVNLKTGAISGVEALIRWVHPTRGVVSPAQFIQIAEDTGLIVPIGAWVLREACAQARAWLDAGLPALAMAVNVSAMQFREENFVDDLFATLTETRLDPESLELEITESVLMKRVDAAASILKTARERGVKVAIDDFGTGYSSLSYLRKFPVDALKIDQSFVRQISTSGEDTAIVIAIIGMAQGLNLRVVAEGVETAEELAFLRAHRCDEAQGYYFSRPLPAAKFAELLKVGISPKPTLRQVG